jgi:hypothetical protein
MSEPPSAVEACDELFEIIKGTWPDFLRVGFPDGCSPVQETEMFTAYVGGALIIARFHYKVFGLGEEELARLAAMAAKRLISERRRRMEASLQAGALNPGQQPKAPEES